MVDHPFKGGALGDGAKLPLVSLFRYFYATQWSHQPSSAIYIHRSVNSWELKYHNTESVNGIYRWSLRKEGLSRRWYKRICTVSRASKTLKYLSVSVISTRFLLRDSHVTLSQDNELDTAVAAHHQDGYHHTPFLQLQTPSIMPFV